MNDLLENAKRNSKITLEEFFFEFYSKILEFEQETKIKENENIYITKYKQVMRVMMSSMPYYN